MPVLLTLQGDRSLGPDSAFMVSVHAVSPGKGVGTDPQMSVAFPAAGLPPCTAGSCTGTLTADLGPFAGRHFRGNNPDYDLVLKRMSP